MAGDTYAFIDGAYFRSCFEERLRANFGDYGGIRYDQIPFRGTKTFYYDCVDDIKLDNETQGDFDQRVQRQVAEFEKIASHPDWHVRHGTLSGNSRPGGRRARRHQKEVDVLLAVDMMNHAFRQNMERAILVAGDLDFKPVVESLIQLGRHVTVAACEQTCHRELRLAADAFQPITVHQLFGCSKMTDSPGWENRFPTVSIGNIPDPEPTKAPMHRGMAGNRIVKLVQAPASIFGQSYIAFLPEHFDDSFRRSPPMSCLHNDRSLIEKYLIAEFGNLKWS
jgi:uncharacterized LabA/DUF88 family protein